MHPYRIAGIVLGVLAMFFLGFLVVGFLLPSGWDVERSRHLSAPPQEVFGHLDRAEAWGSWTPSPGSGVELFGPAEGPGSGRRWDDPGYGVGEFVLTEVRPWEEVRYRVSVEEGAIRIQGWVRLQPEGEGTRIHWREEGDFGWNPLLGYLAGRMDELQGAQLEASLAALEGLLKEARIGDEATAPPG